MGDQITLTMEQLEKVLENTSVSVRHFLDKLTSIKVEEYEDNKKQVLRD